MGNWLLIACAELTQLRRNLFTIAMAAVLPTALGLLVLWGESDTGKAGTGGATGLLLVMLMTSTAYVAGTTTLAARRRQFVLQRLRSSGAGDLAIVAGILTPTTLLTLLQATLFYGLVLALGGPPQISLGPVIAACLAGTAVASVLAVGTAALTSAPELAQLTTSPIGLAFFGGSLWFLNYTPEEVRWPLLLLPGAAVTQLARDGWQAGPLLALALVGAVGALAAARLAVRDLPR